MPVYARIVKLPSRPLQAVLLVVGLLAALLAAALPTATTAHAAVPDRWGFAYLDNPTPPPGYSPDPTRQWGSWPSPSSTPVTVDQLGLGSYVVHFPQIGGPGGVAHVTAVNKAGDWCQLNAWQPNGPNEDVYVSCYRPGGAPDNSAFTVLYTASTGAPSSPVGSYGYLFSDVSGALLAQYNSTGAANSVGKGGVGIWKAWLPNLGLSDYSGNLQVTAVDPKRPARCKVSDWGPSSSGQTVLVACYDANGKPYDTRWTLSYSYQRAVHGPVYPPKAFGYLWFNGSLPPQTNFNSVGGSNSLGISGSVFIVTMPYVANPPDHSQVTAYGSDPGYCGLATPWDRSGGTASLYVDCFDPGGAPVKGQFFAAYTSAA
ncbi:hypothetical protein ACIQGZ_13020 [Streptomyces sp. NPDC092296]|uniref:hypothetical protein n=1 Tax=Streptomyces sp. NPDC092296 TaxID=3366012 RepID=UPI003821926A